MRVKIWMLVIVAAFLSGCTTTNQNMVSVNQLQNQIVNLEERVEGQEKEIANLKYDLKEAQSRQEEDVVMTKPVASTPSKVTTTVKSSSEADSQGDVAEIVRVSASVSQVQLALKNAGSYDGSVDGKLGPKTKAAIMDFQKKNGLKADGIIGRNTWNELKFYLEK